MLMPDVTAILYDPEVGGGVAFKVNRVTNTRVKGSVTRGVATYDAIGNIQPFEDSSQSSTVEDIRKKGIVIRTTFEFKVGENNGASTFDGPDEVVWDGHTWRITRIDDWAKWGFTVAYATMVMD